MSTFAHLRAEVRRRRRRAVRGRRTPSSRVSRRPGSRGRRHAGVRAHAATSSAIASYGRCEVSIVRSREPLVDGRGARRRCAASRATPVAHQRAFALAEPPLDGAGGDGQEHDPLPRAGRPGCPGRARRPRRATRRRRSPAPRRPRRARARGSAAPRARRRCRRSGRARRRSALSVSVKPTSSRRATRLPTRVLPAPIGPMSTTGGAAHDSGDDAGRRAQRLRDARQVAVEVALASRPPSRRRTSRARRWRARARPSPRRRRRRPGRRRRPSAGGGRRMPPRSRHRPSAARGARSRSASCRPARGGPCPVDMPPSVPPALSLSRVMSPSSSTSSSCASEPGRVVVRKPSPTSTPLIAWMPMSAPASCPSSRRSQCV